MNKKLEQLLKQKQEIEEQIKLIDQSIEQEQKKQKWQPVYGDFCISANGKVGQYKSSQEFKYFGTERQTQEQAEKSRDKMRVFNRLLSYHDEFCPDHEFVIGKYNYCITYNNDLKKFTYKSNDVLDYQCAIYFPEQIAKELSEKLNSGEVEL